MPSTKLSGLKAAKPTELQVASAEASKVLKSLANPHRLMILCLLSQGEMSVSELSEHVPRGQSPLSQHLARRRKEEIVESRQESLVVYYKIVDSKIQKILELMHSLYC